MAAGHRKLSFGGWFEAGLTSNALLLAAFWPPQIRWPSWDCSRLHLLLASSIVTGNGGQPRAHNADRRGVATECSLPWGRFSPHVGPKDGVAIVVWLVFFDFMKGAKRSALSSILRAPITY